MGETDGSSGQNAAGVSTLGKLTACSFVRETYIAINLGGMNTPKDYWKNIVIPDVNDFRQNKNIRSALHAACSLWSAMDWLWFASHRNESNSGAAYEQFMQDHWCLYLACIRDIAEATKHYALRRGGAKNPKAYDDPNQVKVTGLNPTDLTIELWGRETVPMETAVEEVVSHLQSYFQ